MADKQRVLCWSDAASAGTGFGTVSKHILGALHETGNYELHHLAINFHGDFLDRSAIPWQVQPARLLDPKDPHGMKMFVRTLLKGNYDIVWVLNDLYVTNEVTELVEKAFSRLSGKGQKVPKVIYYYPVDCNVPKDGCSFVEMADVPVCYTKHGRAETLKTIPGVESRLREIPHGVDTEAFFPKSKERIAQWKKDIFNISPDTTLVLNVNRNSTRKQIQYSMVAFREFRKQVPNSVMYLHTAVKDQGGDLVRAIRELGMDPARDIIYPTNFSPANPIPVSTLNAVYNSADIFLTTHLGEGWGLTITEAMAAGTPVVCPNNTCMPQQMGTESQRGYMYPCKDLIWIDNSGYREKGLIPDIVEQMMKVHADGPKQDNKKVHAALKWVRRHTWNNIANRWVKLFDKVAADDTLGADKKPLIEDI